MSLSRPGRKVTVRYAGVLLAGGILFGACFSPGAPAQATPGSASTTPAVQEIVKLVNAGVSKEVIKTYIEQLPAYRATAEDIIALKENGVTDELTTALVKRGAEARASSSTANAVAGSGAGPATGSRPYTSIDPESYDFWWYHYAYPRTLAYAYERLSPYYYYPSYGYGFYGPGPFSSYFAAGYPHGGFPAFHGHSGSALHNRAFPPAGLGGRAMSRPR